eukprot:1497686-Alexandrium_andersonii.AAC.1
MPPSRRGEVHQATAAPVARCCENLRSVLAELLAEGRLPPPSLPTPGMHAADQALRQLWLDFR